MLKIALFIKTTSEDEILSVHAIEFDKEGKATGRQFYTPVQFGGLAPAFMEMFYGLTLEQIKNSRTFAEISTDLLKFIGDREVICFSALQTKTLLEENLGTKLKNKFIDLQSQIFQKWGIAETDITELKSKLHLKDPEMFNFTEKECDYCVQIYRLLQD